MKIGLALSGGGIRGIAHAGAIKALEENNIKIDVIGGTSAGSMIASAYAIGYTPNEILELFKKHSEKLVEINKITMVKEIKNFITKKSIKSSGLKTGEDLEKVYNELSKQKNVQKIKDIKMPIIIPSVDIATSKKISFCSKKINEPNYIDNITIGAAVRASSAFPVIYKPFEYKEHLFLDGGILDNTPAKEVKKIGADRVISIKFDSDKVDKTSNAMDIVMKMIDIMGKKISEESLKESDYIITIPSDGTGLLDTEKIEFCFNSGYETTKKQIAKIKAKLEID